MDWPTDELVAMHEDDISGWLAERGLPGLAFVFWDPGARRLATWTDAGEAARRHALERLRPAADHRGPPPRLGRTAAPLGSSPGGPAR